LDDNTISKSLFDVLDTNNLPALGVYPILPPVDLEYKDRVYFYF
jgi:hypothetical protein